MAWLFAGLIALDLALYSALLIDEMCRALRARREQRRLARHGQSFADLNAVLRSMHQERPS